MKFLSLFTLLTLSLPLFALDTQVVLSSGSKVRILTGTVPVTTSCDRSPMLPTDGCGNKLRYCACAPQYNQSDSCFYGINLVTVENGVITAEESIATVNGGSCSPSYKGKMEVIQKCEEMVAQNPACKFL